MTEAVVAMLQRHPFVEDFEAAHVDKLATLAVAGSLRSRPGDLS